MSQMQSAGVVVADPVTLVKLGDVQVPSVWIAGLGTSPVTTYVESAAGIAAGARGAVFLVRYLLLPVD